MSSQYLLIWNIPEHGHCVGREYIYNNYLAKFVTYIISGCPPVPITNKEREARRHQLNCH